MSSLVWSSLFLSFLICLILSILSISDMSFNPYQDIEYDPQPGLDVDSLLSSLESESDQPYTPMTVDESDDAHSQASPAVTSPVEDLREESDSSL